MDIYEQEKITAVVKAAWDAGINFFDNAEFYGKGKVETLFGNAFKELNIPRENAVISTKVFWSNSTSVNGCGLSRKHIIEGANASLKRLQLEYVDLIFAHRYDEETPLEETCRAFHYLIEQGKALYWGTSEWPVKKIWEAIGICKRLGLHEPIIEQPQYNMMERTKMEKDYIELFDEHGMGTTVWSPLAGGILTGKYNDEIPKDSRFVTAWFGFMYEPWLGEKNIEKTRTTLKALAQIAKEIGCTQAQLALAWVVKNKDVSTCLIGSTKIAQLEENLKALEFVPKITSEVEKKINEVMGNQPKLEDNMRTHKPNPPRRG